MKTTPLHPAILTTAELAQETGMHRVTVWRTACADPALAGCRIRKGFRCWSRARLIAAGFLAVEPVAK